MVSGDFVLLSLQIATMLACALAFGQLFRRMGQPAVLGEIVGGIFLGPTLLGAVAPELYGGLFHGSAGVTTAREASIKLGMLFFLFIAGLETNLSHLRLLARKALLIGLVGTFLPMAIGVGLVALLPRAFWGDVAAAHLTAFALFVGMSLANSANPVIARILMDLGLLKTDFGTIVMTATLVDDFVNWTVFAIILSDIAPVRAGSDLAGSVVMVAVFFALLLTIGRRVSARALRWLRDRVAWPTGFIIATTILILVVSSITESLGIHAFLGAFITGAVMGGKGEAKDEASQAISHFALSYFAPLYFVSMGLNANFVTQFDVALVLLIVGAACLSKIGSVLLGARLAGMRIDRYTVAISFALNARGATGIILAGVGLEHGLISERIFVAMVVMALVTSLLSSPAIKRLAMRSLPGGAPA